MDKIGAFRFTIRGWSVTLVVASIFAVGSSKLVSPYLLLLLLIFVFLFLFIEWKQNNLQRLFAERAFQIEKEIRRIIRAKPIPENFPHDIGFTPRIAHHLSEAARKAAPTGRFVRLRRWIRDPDSLFYAAQIAAILAAVVVLRYSRTESHEVQVNPPITIIEYQHQAEQGSQVVDEKSGSTNDNKKGKKTKSR